MGGNGYQEERDGNRRQCPWLVGPSDEGIKVATHPSAYVEEKEEAPQRNTQKTKYIEYYTLYPRG